MTKRICTIGFAIIALFYAYGALVHVMNMAGLMGFRWLDAPTKWQVLDLVYLVLDFIVAIGLVRRWQIAFAAFYVAAISQIVLYTLLRSWIIDVPPAFARSAEDIAYLDMLVGFHLLTVLIVSVLLYMERDGLRARQSH